MERHRFHTTVHARPRNVEFSEPSLIDNRPVRTLRIMPQMLANPMAVSFEEAASILQQLPRMLFEPDGSFVWSSESHQPAWQVDGVLYDRGGRLILVDLRGECTRTAFGQLVAAFGIEQTPIMFQVIRQAIFLDEDEFYRFTRVEPG